ncbi:MAG: hypothetical protein WCS77_07400 [Elusimicrobiaceae bacterium]
MRIIFSSGPFVASAAAFAALAVAVLLFRAKSLPLSAKILRFTAVLAVFTLALSPELARVRRYKKYPPVAVLIDSSVYMKGPSVEKGNDKFSFAVNWCRANLKTLSGFSRPEFFVYGKDLKPLDLDRPGKAEGGASSVSSALEEAAAVNPPPARILVITDGISRAERLSAPLPKISVPADFLAVGVKPAARDLRLAALKYSDFAFLHLNHKVEFSFTARGLKNSPVRAVIVQDGKIAAEAKFSPSSDYQVINSTFSLKQGSLGDKKAVFELSAPGAKTLKRELGWQVIHEKRRIMYLCGRPSYDYALLREFLKNDPNNELVTFVILRNPENFVPVLEQEMSLIPFPAQQVFVDDLDLFDVVILDNFSFTRLRLPQQYGKSLNNFVAKGGSLVTMGTGNIYSQENNQGYSLYEMLPFEMPASKDAFRDWKTSFLPQKHPVADIAGGESEFLWSQMPELDGFTVFPGLRKGADLIFSAQAPDGRKYPAAASWKYGQGKVLSLATASTWRWRTLSSSNPKLSSVYGLFWNRVIQFLNGSLDLKTVKLSADDSTLTEGETAKISLTVLGPDRSPLNDPTASVNAYAVSLDGRKTSLSFQPEKAGVFRAEIPDASAGKNTVRAAVVSGGADLGADSITFSVRSRGSDISDFSFIEAMASETGGRAYLPENFDLKKWGAQLPSAETAEEVVSRKQFSSVWLAGAFVLFLLGLEWLIRRVRGIL